MDSIIEEKPTKKLKRRPFPDSSVILKRLYYYYKYIVSVNIRNALFLLYSFSAVCVEE